jgi:uncharacterized protein YdeI (YjbR/CyaY-like superfamily)
VVQDDSNVTVDARTGVFAHRREAKSRIYAYERAHVAALDSKEEARFRKNKPASRFFEAQPQSYRHLVIWRIVSAKRVETREARLAKLIEASRNGERL